MRIKAIKSQILLTFVGLAYFTDASHHTISSSSCNLIYTFHTLTRWRLCDTWQDGDTSYSFKVAVVIQLEVESLKPKPHSDAVCLHELHGTYTVIDVLVAVSPGRRAI